MDEFDDNAWAALSTRFPNLYDDITAKSQLTPFRTRTGRIIGLFQWKHKDEEVDGVYTFPIRTASATPEPVAAPSTPHHEVVAKNFSSSLFTTCILLLLLSLGLIVFVPLTRYRRRIWEPRHGRRAIPALFVDALSPNEEEEDEREAVDADNAQPPMHRIDWPVWGIWSPFELESIAEAEQRWAQSGTANTEDAPSIWHSYWALLWWVLAVIGSFVLYLYQVFDEVRQIPTVRGAWWSTRRHARRLLRSLLKILRNTVLNIRMVRDIAAIQIRITLGSNWCAKIARAYRVATSRATISAIGILVVAALVWDRGYPLRQASSYPILAPDTDDPLQLNCAWIDRWLTLGRQTRMLVDGYGTTTIADCWARRTVVPAKPCPTSTVTRSTTLFITRSVKVLPTVTPTRSPGTGGAEAWGWVAANGSAESRVLMDTEGGAKWCALCRQVHCCEHGVH